MNCEIFTRVRKYTNSTLNSHYDPPTPIPVSPPMRPMRLRHRHGHADEAHKEDETDLQYCKHNCFKLVHIQLFFAFSPTVTFLTFILEYVLQLQAPVAN